MISTEAAQKVAALPEKVPPDAEEKEETERANDATPTWDLTLTPADLPHVGACAAFAAWIGRRNWRGHSLKRLAPWRSVCRYVGVGLFALPRASREADGLLVQHRTAGWLIFYSARAGGKAKARGVCREMTHLSLRTSHDSPLLAVPEERQWRVPDAARRRVAAMLVGGGEENSHETV